jgi:hypothetical protein
METGLKKLLMKNRGVQTSDKGAAKKERPLAPANSQSLLLEDVSHQSRKDVRPGWGARLSSPNFLSRLYQKILANTHETSRWLIDSGSWSHNGQLLL